MVLGLVRLPGISAVAAAQSGWSCHRPGTGIAGRIVSVSRVLLLPVSRGCALAEHAGLVYRQRRIADGSAELTIGLVRGPLQATGRLAIGCGACRPRTSAC